MDETMPGSRLRIVSLAVVLAGLGLILWLATADTTRAGHAYGETGKRDESLFDGHEIGQIVVPSLDQLVGIRLWLRCRRARGAALSRCAFARSSSRKFWRSLNCRWPNWQRTARRHSACPRSRHFR